MSVYKPIAILSILALIVVVLMPISVLLHGCASEVPQPVDPDPIVRDLADVVASDTLRVISRNHPLTYYLHKGTRRGFDFELINRFAEEQGLVVEVVLPPTWGDMIPWLLEGKGDVIASMMTVTPARDERIEFTTPYKTVRQVAVGRRDTLPPMTPEEFAGRTVLVREGSSYDENLRALRDSTGVDFTLIYHDELAELEDPVQLVANGKYPLTVVDNTIAHLEQHFYVDLVIGAALTEDQDIAWGVRPNAPELLAALNEFLDRHDRSAFFNILKKRYFQSPRRFRVHRGIHIAQYQEGRLSRYDDFFRAAADEVDIDWRLLAAQSYHESRFYPDQVSWAGAIGLMQLMPATARSVGVRDIYDPKENIRGGAIYMRRLLDTMDENIGETGQDWRNRISFALACYNAGIGHVFNARRLVREQGNDPDRWEHVADALVLLEKPEYYTREGYAFVRGASVKQYVNDILHRYDIFCDIMERIDSQDSDEDIPEDDSIALTDLMTRTLPTK